MDLSLTQEELAALASRCWRSHSEFCRVFLPNWFPTKMPWVHRGIAALLRGKCDFLLDFGSEVWRDEVAEWTIEDLQKILDNFIEEGTKRPIFTLEVDADGNPSLTMNIKENIAIIMPRGFSKTTLVNSINLSDMLYLDKDFFLYVSESAAHAEKQLGTLKAELEDNEGLPDNELLWAVFGAHKPSRQSPLKWTENYIETLKGVMVGAVGRGGQIRGFGKRAKRPAVITFDDIEDAESVLVDTQRKKDSTWFFSTAMPAVRKGGGCRIIGTLLHTDAILNKCIMSSAFTAVRFGAIDRQGEALWPWMMDLEAIEKKRMEAAEVGELPGFYLEYMSEYKTDEARMFPESKLVYISRPLSSFVGISEAMDPAISDSPSAAECAFAVVGIEPGGNKHVLDFYSQKGMDPADQADKWFEFHMKWLADFPPEMQRHGIEAMQYQRALLPTFRTQMYARSRTLGSKVYHEIIPIFHGKVAKLTRVQGILKPLVWSGHITFQERWPALHTQLVDWPNGLLDGPDVVSMAVALLDPYAALNLGDEGLADLEKDPEEDLPELVLAGFRGAP